MALLSAPGLMVAFLFTPKYARLAAHGAVLERAILVDRLLLVTLTMAAMGTASLVIWEGVFPDRRDARILSPLPVRDSTQVLARLGALTALFGMLAAGSAVVPAVLFSAMAAGFSGSPNPIREIVAQLLTSVAAGAFPFFLLIALQCLLFAGLGRTIAARLSVVLQGAFGLGLLQMLVLPGALGTQDIDAVRASLADAADRLPAVWFAGLFEVLADRGGPDSTRLAGIASTATGAAMAATIVLYVASFRKLTRQALETLNTGRRWAVPFGWASGGARAEPPASGAHSSVPARSQAAGGRGPGNRSLGSREWLSGTPVERAVCGFTLRTIVRSRQLRMLLAIYGAVAIAIVLLGTAPALARGVNLTRPGAALGSATPVLIFIMVVALRSLFALPVEPKAIWAIRVREPVSRHDVVNGVRRALCGAGGMPAGLLTAAALVPLWGWVAAARHSLLWIVLGLLLVEFLLAEFCKIPFTCPGLPGRGALRIWPWYYFGFVLYAYALSVFEFGPLRSRAAFAVFLGLALGALAAFTERRRRALAERTGLEFAEADPHAMFEGFGLSEALTSRVRAAE
jgi:hypothetical protein